MVLSENIVTALYIASSVLFILSLGGLSGQESAKRALGTHGSEQDLDYTQKTSSKNVLHPGPHHRHAHGAVSRTQQQQADSEMHV